MSILETIGAIYPISALAKNQKAVKESAAKGIVRITEQGVGAYVFGTEDEYRNMLIRAKEEGALEERLRDAITAGRADKDAGRVDSDVKGFFADLKAGLEK